MKLGMLVGCGWREMRARRTGMSRSDVKVNEGEGRKTRRNASEVEWRGVGVEVEKRRKEKEREANTGSLYFILLLTNWPSAIAFP